MKFLQILTANVNSDFMEILYDRFSEWTAHRGNPQIGRARIEDDGKLLPWRTYRYISHIIVLNEIKRLLKNKFLFLIISFFELDFFLRFVHLQRSRKLLLAPMPIQLEKNLFDHVLFC